MLRTSLGVRLDCCARALQTIRRETAKARIRMVLLSGRTNDDDGVDAQSMVDRRPYCRHGAAGDYGSQSARRNKPSWMMCYCLLCLGWAMVGEDVPVVAYICPSSVRIRDPVVVLCVRRRRRCWRRMGVVCRPRWMRFFDLFLHLEIAG